MSDCAKLLSSPANFAVVQLPGRKFPGVVFQGDSLKILSREIEKLKRDVSVYKNIEIEAGLDDIAERISGALKHYEKVCADRGIALPYIAGD